MPGVTTLTGFQPESITVELGAQTAFASSVTPLDDVASAFVTLPVENFEFNYNNTQAVYNAMRSTPYVAINASRGAKSTVTGTMGGPVVVGVASSLTYTPFGHVFAAFLGTDTQTQLGTSGIYTHVLTASLVPSPYTIRVTEGVAAATDVTHNILGVSFTSVSLTFSVVDGTFSWSADFVGRTVVTTATAATPTTITLADMAGAGLAGGPTIVGGFTSVAIGKSAAVTTGDLVAVTGGTITMEREVTHTFGSSTTTLTNTDYLASHYQVRGLSVTVALSSVYDPTIQGGPVNPDGLPGLHEHFNTYYSNVVIRAANTTRTPTAEVAIAEVALSTTAGFLEATDLMLNIDMKKVSWGEAAPRVDRSSSPFTVDITGRALFPLGSSSLVTNIYDGTNVAYTTTTDAM